MTTYQYRPQFQTTILDDPAQYLRAREAEAMCDHVWIFEARTLSTQPVRRRCGMCGVYRMEPRCREPGIRKSKQISVGLRAPDVCTSIPNCLAATCGWARKMELDALSGVIRMATRDTL